MVAPSLPSEGATSMTSSPQSTRSVLRNLLAVMDKHELPVLSREVLVTAIAACDRELDKQGKAGRRVA